MKKLILAAAITSAVALNAMEDLEACLEQKDKEISAQIESLATAPIDCKDGGSLVNVNVTLNNITPDEVDDFVSCRDQKSLEPHLIINLVKCGDAPYVTQIPHQLKTVEDVFGHLYSKTEKYLDELSGGAMSAIKKLGLGIELKIRDKRACITVTNKPGIEEEEIAKGKTLIEKLICKLNLNIVSVRKVDSCNKVLLPIEKLDTRCHVLEAFLNCSQRASMNLIYHEWAKSGIVCHDKE